MQTATEAFARTGAEPAAGASAHGGLSARVKAVGLVFAALVCGQLAMAGQIGSVLSSDFFPDTDDAMRMVQIRNLMGGQGWFDMLEPRLDPPAGVLSHWSRLIDAPLVVLIKGFGLFLSPETAERAARLAWPLLLTAVLYVAVMRLTALVLGRERALYALPAIFLTVPFQMQFQPGRIDHHSAQIVLLVAMTACVAASIARPRFAAAAAAAFAGSLAISLENLPFAPALALPVALWLLRGGREDSMRLRWFALGAVVSGPLLFVLTVGPERWLSPHNDAFSAAHLAVLLLGALGCLGLAALRAESVKGRMLAATAVAASAVALVLFFFPSLLRSPYADVDPLVRSLWLDHVTEVQPVYVAMRTEPAGSIAMTITLLVGLGGALLAARRSTGAARYRWLAVAIPLAVGVCCLLWMIRAAYSATPLAVPGIVYLGLRFQAWAAQRTRHASELVGFVLFVLATSSPAISATLTPLFAKKPDAAPSSSSAPTTSPGEAETDGVCFARDTLRALDVLPKGVVFGDIDLGPHILAHTKHAALAGPYHRDRAGNRAVLSAMQIDRVEALAPAMAASGADYVVLCRSEMKSWRVDAAALERATAAKRVSGLRRIGIAPKALVVFAVERAAR